EPSAKIRQRRKRHVAGHEARNKHDDFAVERLYVWPRMGERVEPINGGIEGRLGWRVSREELCALPGVIGLLLRQFALATSQTAGACKAKPQPRHPVHPQSNITTLNGLFNAF